MAPVGLSFRDLEYLVAVAECRHFGRAAQRCAVSQPALSAQIKKLENFLGVMLFERVPGRGVFVTSHGERIVEQARFILAKASALIATARDTIEFNGPFRLGAIPTLGPYLLPYLLRPLKEHLPHVSLILSEARTQELVEDVLNGRVDAALACAPAVKTGLHATPLFFEPFLLMHPPQISHVWPLPFVEETEAEMLEHEQLLLLGEGHCLRDHVLSACGCGMAENAVGVKRCATGLEMLRHMVAAGEGISLMPALAAKALGSIDGVLTYSTIPDDKIGRVAVLLSRNSDPRTTLLSTIVQMIRAHTPSPGQAL